MAFELFFFKQIGAVIELDTVVEYFSSQKNFIIKPLDDDEYAFNYYNELTNVRFTMMYSEKQELETSLTFDPNYEYCYTAFMMSYLRPHFFPQEAMPIVEAFSRHFNLYIIDVQNLNNKKSTLKLYSKEELMDSYLKNNKIAAIEINEQMPLLNTTYEKSHYLYAYLTQMDNLSQKYNNINIPELMMMSYYDRDVYSVFSWIQANPTIIPKSDFVLITFEKKSLFGQKKQKSGLIKYADLLEIFKNFLKKSEDDLDLYIISEKSTELIELFNSLDTISINNYKIIQNDEYVDITFE